MDLEHFHGGCYNNLTHPCPTTSQHFLKHAQLESETQVCIIHPLFMQLFLSTAQFFDRSRGNILSPTESLTEEIIGGQFDGLFRSHQCQVDCCTCRKKTYQSIYDKYLPLQRYFNFVVLRFVGDIPALDPLIKYFVCECIELCQLYQISKSKSQLKVYKHSCPDQHPFQSNNFGSVPRSSLCKWYKVLTCKLYCFMKMSLGALDFRKR